MKAFGYILIGAFVGFAIGQYADYILNRNYYKILEDEVRHYVK